MSEVNSRTLAVGWVNEYLKGRASLEKLLLKVPELRKHPEYVQQLTAKKNKSIAF